MVVDTLNPVVMHQILLLFNKHLNLITHILLPLNTIHSVDPLQLQMNLILHLLTKQVLTHLNNNNKDLHSMLVLIHLNNNNLHSTWALVLTHLQTLRLPCQLDLKSIHHVLQVVPILMYHLPTVDLLLLQVLEVMEAITLLLYYLLLITLQTLVDLMVSMVKEEVVFTHPATTTAIEIVSLITLHNIRNMDFM
ncbi:hypothetical protein BD770DRAFT_238584 [Pilaira anomala]|nr:hypothetical protein BD770DRAFT_238584 [Pilaira anomala]